MVLSTPKDCGGIDLPFVTHIVAYNAVEGNIARQVAGRGQRLGRTHNLTIVRIVNEHGQ
jgi:hypothetical protein